MSYQKRISIYRGEIEESIHFGAASVVDSSGKHVYSIGNPDLVTFPRSSLKFVQAVALVETGAADAFKLDQQHLSLACASHMGEPMHIKLVSNWLNRLGLNESDLACGPDYPLDKETCYQVLKSGSDPRKSFHNCSGKHAGFLTVCRHLGFVTKDYHLPEHPVQQMFKDDLSYFTRIDGNNFNWAVDGCGFPAPALSLHSMAYAMARYADQQILTESKSKAVKTLRQAVVAYPEFMSGTNDFATQIINATQGEILVKTGAEGYFIAVIASQKTGIALKIADGAKRASEYFMVTLLDELNLLSPSAKEKLQHLLHPDIVNSRQQVVGRIASS